MSTIFDVSIRHMDSATVHELERVLTSPEILKRGTCEVEIDSKGGDVLNGLKMVDIIKKSQIFVNATVPRVASSMAAVILQCCHVRRMGNNATLNYHYGSWRISFLVYYDKEIEKLNRKNALKYQQAMIDPIVARTGMTENEVHKLLREDRKLKATEAFIKKMVDEII